MEKAQQIFMCTLRLIVLSTLLQRVFSFCLLLASILSCSGRSTVKSRKRLARDLFDTTTTPAGRVL